MKFKTLLATVAVLSTANVSADTKLYGDGSDYVGAAPVGILVSDVLKAALVNQQLGANCIDSSTGAVLDSVACTPNISSVELAALLRSNPSSTWADYGVANLESGDYAGANSAYGAYLPNVWMCGDPANDDTTADFVGATRVAAAHVGVNCSGGSFSSNYVNTVANGLFGAGFQTDVSSCATSVNGLDFASFSFAAIGESASTGYGWAKLDGTYPSLSEFIAGNYNMFGDVHGDVPAAGTYVAASSNPPMHEVVGLNRTVSDICAPGTNASADLIN